MFEYALAEDVLCVINGGSPEGTEKGVEGVFRVRFRVQAFGFTAEDCGTLDMLVALSLLLLHRIVTSRNPSSTCSLDNAFALCLVPFPEPVTPSPKALTEPARRVAGKK